MSDTPIHKYMEMKRKSQEASQARYAEESRKRLDKIISTKMNTTFVGAIATFERNFGFLWGHGKHDADKTDEERQLFAIWGNVRNEVLNNGNNQLRALRNELQQHNISWNRHTLILKNEGNSDVNNDQ